MDRCRKRDELVSCLRILVLAYYCNEAMLKQLQSEKNITISTNRCLSPVIVSKQNPKTLKLLILWIIITLRVLKLLVIQQIANK